MAYDKYEVKDALEIEDVYEILDSLGAEPQMHDDYIVAKTICHGGDSHKLYYYANTKLLKCFTGDCGTMDIFEMLQKVQHLDLNEAVYYVVNFFNLQYRLEEVDDTYLQEDWKIMRRWQELSPIKGNDEKLILPEIDKGILKYYPQPHIQEWENQYISKEVCDYMDIRYDPIEGGIIIPHLDENGRLVGIRQRTLIEENEKWGKYRPWSQMEYNGKERRWKPRQFNHPLGFNLYGLYQARENINKMGIALVFESEKAVLQVISYLGLSNDLAVAVCGSSLSKYQFNLLREAGAKEICIAFDADYEKIGDENWEQVVKKLQKIYDKYSAYVDISFLFDTKGTMLGYKDSPTDCGKEVFMELWKNRVNL